MTMEMIMEYFVRYGEIAVFVIVLLEYLNLPGFPAGVIMPLAGAFAAKGRIDFLPILAVTVAAGLTGSLILYWLGYKGEEKFLEKYLEKFPKSRDLIEKQLHWIRKNGCTVIFVGKLIPMARTLISIPAGVAKMRVADYVISSVLGICVWNLVFVGAGYLLGETVLVF